MRAQAYRKYPTKIAQSARHYLYGRRRQLEHFGQHGAPSGQKQLQLQLKIQIQMQIQLKIHIHRKRERERDRSLCVWLQLYSCIAWSRFSFRFSLVCAPNTKNSQSVLFIGAITKPSIHPSSPRQCRIQHPSIPSIVSELIIDNSHRNSFAWHKKKVAESLIWGDGGDGNGNGNFCWNYRA